MADAGWAQGFHILAAAYDLLAAEVLVDLGVCAQEAGAVGDYAVFDDAVRNRNAT